MKNIESRILTAFLMGTSEVSNVQNSYLEKIEPKFKTEAEKEHSLWCNTNPMEPVSL